MASIRARRRRSSAGSRRWPGTGTGRRRRSSGAASEPPDVAGSENGDAWADQVLVSQSYQDDRHRIMATPEASDPLVEHRGTVPSVDAEMIRRPARGAGQPGGVEQRDKLAIAGVLVHQVGQG